MGGRLNLAGGTLTLDGGTRPPYNLSTGLTETQSSEEGMMQIDLRKVES